MGQAHIWAQPWPNMGPAHGPGPWGRARARPGHFWTRAFFRNSILKNLNIAHVIEYLCFGSLTKKTHAEK